MITVEEVDRMFDEGFDCSQIVLAEASGNLGLSREDAFRIASCFGIGMAQGSVCGAATGALIAIGMRYGNCRPGDLASKQKVFDVRDEFMRRFEEMNGHVMCPDFLGRRVDTLQDLMVTRCSGIYDRCPMYCVNAVRILEDLLRSSRSPRPGDIGDLEPLRFEQVLGAELDLHANPAAADVDDLAVRCGGIQHRGHLLAHAEGGATHVHVPGHLQELLGREHIYGFLAYGCRGLLQIQFEIHRYHENIVLLRLGDGYESLEHPCRILSEDIRHGPARIGLLRGVRVNLVRYAEPVEMPHGIGLRIHDPENAPKQYN